ncbi:MAG: hypothetical protein GF350_09555 [Chitinivibrionales bacterium]|nr:hypothetical protein [Chitinivibrionales bacterium]
MVTARATWWQKADKREINSALQLMHEFLRGMLIMKLPKFAVCLKKNRKRPDLSQSLTMPFEKIMFDKLWLAMLFYSYESIEEAGLP